MKIQVLDYSQQVIRRMQIPGCFGLLVAAIAGAVFWIARRTQKPSMTGVEENSTNQKHPSFELPSNFDGIPFAGVKPKKGLDNFLEVPSAQKSQIDS